MVSTNHADVVVHHSGDVVIFLSPESARALAVLLHVAHDNPVHRLSMLLVPLMGILDRKLIKLPKTIIGG